MRAAAHRFAEVGAEVVIAEINQTRGEAVAQELQNKCGKGRFIQTNVASASECQALVQQTIEAYGHIDTLVNNAGVIFGGDWPVATQATDYPRWVETLEWAVSGSSESEMRMLFHDNAVDFYRL